jgi:acetate kinase
MRIFVINCGSSSIKFSLFKAAPSAKDDLRLLLEGELRGIETPMAKLEICGPGVGNRREAQEKIASMTEGFRFILKHLEANDTKAIAAIGYRIVHPGAHLHEHRKIDTDVLGELQAAAKFAPLHDPAAIEVVREGQLRFPGIPQYACFDTVFHQTMPPEAFTYALPENIRAQGVRRYGFHGLSCESIVHQLRNLGELPRRLVIAHLGSGCSVTAVLEGRSIDTTMGMTPAGGVVMGTRPGDLDPGLMTFLFRQQSGDIPQASASMEKMLNHASGTAAISGMANNMEAVRAAANAGNPAALLAEKIFSRGIAKAIGAFCWLMGGLDAIAFSGGIGEHDAAARAEILGGLEALGVRIDSASNLAPANGLRRISASKSKSVIYAVPAQEERMIARHVNRMYRPHS